MNSKMAINTYLTTAESKNKLCKQEKQRQNHGTFDGCQIRGFRRISKKSQEIKKYKLVVVE